MAFNWEQSAFLGYMVEQYEKDLYQENDDTDEDEDEDANSDNNTYWPF